MTSAATDGTRSKGSRRRRAYAAILAVLSAVAALWLLLDREAPAPPGGPQPARTSVEKTGDFVALATPPATGIDGARATAAAPQAVPGVSAPVSGGVAARVAGRASGRPRARAHLILAPSDRVGREDLAEPRSTDELGVARWEGLAPGTWSMTTPDGRRLPIAVEAGTTTEVRIELGEGIAIRGVVVDAHGAPVRSASVRVAQQVARHAPLPIAETDANGLFRIEDAGPARWISAAAAGSIASPWIAIPNDPGTPEIEIRVALGPAAARLLVVVEDDSGRPIVGAWVRAAARGSVLELAGADLRAPIDEVRGRTGDDGRWRTDVVPPGAIDVEVRAPGRRGSRRTIEARADVESEARFVLEREARIVGTVRTPDGEPVVGASVRRASDPGDGPALATSGATGAFEVEGLAPGPISLRARHASGAEAAADFAPKAGDVLRWDCVLAIDATIHGRVVDVGGGPRDDVFVFVHAEGGDADLVGEFQPRADGTFVARVAAGRTYALEVRGEATAIDPLALVEHVEPDRGEVVIEIPRAGPAGTVAGAITDSDGRLCAASLAALRPGEDPFAAVRGDANSDGRFRVGPLAPGTWKLLATVPGGEAQVVARFDVASAGGDVDLGVLRLGRVGSMRVRLDTPGAPTNGVILVLGEDGDALVARPVRADAWSTPILVPGLAVGRYRVRFEWARGRSEEARVEVVAGIESDVRVLVEL